MGTWSHELRLALTLPLNAAVFACAYRFARRRGGSGPLQAACDAFLVYFVIQYVSVALPGALGAFNLWTMSLVALLASAALCVFAGEAGSPFSRRACPPLTRDYLGLIACATLLIAYLAAHVIDKRFHPPLATDALVYHLPTAVQWIQTGKLGLFPTWYWNPAATYSPATSSTFMAWFMAPAGNDVFVRFVQGPPLLFIFMLVARLCREFGCSRTLAGLLALAAAMSRPYVSEALIPKDDLFITAFFAAAVLSLAASNLRDPLGPWRAGLALGMVLACKYTVLLVCPLFLFMIDAPTRAGWRPRHWLIALAVGVPLFAPWHVRNVMLTGNPLFPVDVKLFGHMVFSGLFGTERDQQLRTAGGVWRMLGQTYHSIPWPVLVPLVGGWLGAVVAAGRAILRDPLRRACVVGVPVTVAVFLLTSPHHEVRYMYPLLLLVFAIASLPLVRWVKWESARLTVAASLVVLSTATAFDIHLARYVGWLLGNAAVVTAIVVAAIVLQTRWLRLDRRRLAYAGIAMALALGMMTYVLWSAYVAQYYVKTAQIEQRQPGDEAAISFAWRHQYPAEAPLWTFVRENVPDDATIAVANTFFVYPFYDAFYQRHVGYAPTRRGLHDLLGFPRMGDTVPGDVIVQRMTQVQNTDSDKATWLENLRRMKAQYLVIAKFEHEPSPPERTFVAEEPARFELLFDHPAAGSVYRVR